MNFGILTHVLDSSQMGFAISTELNSLHDTTDINPFLFYEVYGKIPHFPKFCMQQTCLSWNFKGVLLSTSASLTHKLKTCIHAKKKLFYVWNLEWISNLNTYTYYRDVFMDEDVDLIARSEYHAELISQVWRKPKYIVDNFNHEQLKRIIEES